MADSEYPRANSRREVDVADPSSVQSFITSSNKHSAGTKNLSLSEETSTTAYFTSSQDTTTPSVTLTGSSSATASETSSTRGGLSVTSTTKNIGTGLAITTSPSWTGTGGISTSSTSLGITTTSRAEAPGTVSQPPMTEMTSVPSTSTRTPSTSRLVGSIIMTLPSATATMFSSTASSSGSNYSMTQQTSSISWNITQSTPVRASSRTSSSSITVQPSSTVVTNLSSVTVIFPPSSPFTTKYISSRPTPFTVALPVTTTLVIFTTAPRHSTITVETGALRTGIPNAAGFSQDTGAIVGVSIAAFITLLSLLFFIFFACRRYRRRRRKSVYVDGLRRLAREFSYRSPVDGDEEHFVDKAPSRYPVSSQAHSADGTNDGALPGDPPSQGHSSSESATVTMVPMGTVFGGQAYISGLDQVQGPRRHVVGTDAHWEPGLLSHSQTAISTEAWRVPAGLYPYPHANNAARRSTASLFLPSASSNGHTTLSSSADDGLFKARKASSGVMHESGKPAWRHYSTPPTAFKGAPTSAFNLEPERQSQLDTSSMSKLFNRLFTGRPVSVQSGSSTQLTARDIEYDDHVYPTLPVFSPSLLNPPIIMQPVLTFPQDITKRGYTPEHEQDSRFGTFSESGTAPWPAATLPEMTPSPAPTDSSSGMINHLLHPRLALGLPRSEQASVASLRDNEDYSRPINGLVNNHLRSTTTLETHDAGQFDNAEE